MFRCYYYYLFIGHFKPFFDAFVIALLVQVKIEWVGEPTKISGKHKYFTAAKINDEEVCLANKIVKGN
jgi:hypothetical protein